MSGLLARYATAGPDGFREEAPKHFRGVVGTVESDGLLLRRIDRSPSSSCRPEETENALVALDREWTHNATLRRTVDVYADALRVAQAQYQARLASFLNVLDADHSLASARDSLAQSDVALSVDAIALYKALGGGWQDVMIETATR